MATLLGSIDFPSFGWIRLGMGISPFTMRLANAALVKNVAAGGSFVFARRLGSGLPIPASVVDGVARKRSVSYRSALQLEVIERCHGSTDQ
jgi:hypothetical protein